jgi:hypothetical protein
MRNLKDYDKFVNEEIGFEIRPANREYDETDEIPEESEDEGLEDAKKLSEIKNFCEHVLALVVRKNETQGDIREMAMIILEKINGK